MIQPRLANAGFKAKADVVTGLKNKLSTMAAAVTPSGMVAEAHNPAHRWSAYRAKSYPTNQ
jgi:hypothetical protein